MRSLRFVLVVSMASLWLLGMQPSDANAQRGRAMVARPMMRPMISPSMRPMTTPTMRPMFSHVRPTITPFRSSVAHFNTRAFDRRLFDNRFRSGFFFPYGGLYGGYYPGYGGYYPGYGGYNPGLASTGGGGDYGSSPSVAPSSYGVSPYSEDGPYGGSLYGDYGPYANLPYGPSTLSSGSPVGASGAYSGSPAAPAQSVRVVSVGLSDNYFQPARLTVAVGTTVQWTNFGQQVHTITWDSDGWGSGELAPREVYSHTFNRPGTYAYHCARYKEMRGVVVVVAGGSAG